MSLRSLLVLLCLAATAPAIRLQAGGARVPLCEGLTIVTAIADPRGDYESIKRVVKVSSAGLEIAVNGDRPIAGGTRKLKAVRTVRRADIASATLYAYIFEPQAPKLIPGSTALGTSRDVLARLKTAGVAELSLTDPSTARAPAEEMQRSAWRFSVKRVGAATLTVVVNGEPTDLPTVEARGSYLGDKAEFVFLDDDDNPLALKYRVSDGPRPSDVVQLQVVRLSYDCQPPEAGSSRLERALREHGTADIYEIFFEFGSDQLKEESTPTLVEIAAVLSRNPDWRLSIGGHTDSIAGDAFNQDLSTRRAQAVLHALVNAHGIGAGRLTAIGHGESRPKDRNDTLEGRARNRRVELSRLP